jgi:hypothetical protein
MFCFCATNQSHWPHVTTEHWKCALCGHICAQGWSTWGSMLKAPGTIPPPHPPPKKEEEMCLVWHIWNFIYLSWSAGDEAKALGMPGSTLCHCATPPAAVLMNLNLNDHLQLLATILDRTVLYFQVMFPGIRHHTQISWIIANSKFNFDLEFVPKVKVQGKRRNTLYTITNRVDKKEKCNWSPKQLKSIHHQQIILIFSFLL